MVWAALMANITDVDGNFTISQGKNQHPVRSPMSFSTSTNGLIIAGLYGSLKVLMVLTSYVDFNASVDALRRSVID